MQFQDGFAKFECRTVWFDDGLASLSALEKARELLKFNTCQITSCKSEWQQSYSFASHTPKSLGVIFGNVMCNQTRSLLKVEYICNKEHTIFSLCDLEYCVHVQLRVAALWRQKKKVGLVVKWFSVSDCCSSFEFGLLIFFLSLTSEWALWVWLQLLCNNR